MKIPTFSEFITEKRGLWDNVWAKRKKGKRPAKPGDENYPEEEAWKAAQEKPKKKEK
jgi:hypothetical protein